MESKKPASDLYPTSARIEVPAANKQGLELRIKQSNLPTGRYESWESGIFHPGGRFLVTTFWRHEQIRRCAEAWADAQLQAFHLSHTHRSRLLARWSVRLRQAGITAVGAANGGTVPVKIDLTRSPAAAAHHNTPRACDINNQLRAATRLLWLSVLIGQPRRTRSLGRIYTPADCTHALVDVLDVLRDPVLWRWVYTYSAELNWRYRQTHQADHKTTRVLVALDPWKHAIPHIPQRRAA